MTKQNRKPQNKRIPSAAVPGAKTIQFSFKHLVTTNQKFPVHDCSSAFWSTLMDELKRYELMSVDEFVYQDSTCGRHIVNFDETSEAQGFAGLGLGEGDDSEAWQFDVGSSRSDGWRVIGYLAENVFFIVWLDSQHALYSGRQQR